MHFPEQKLLVAGGVVSNDGWPLMDYKTGGWIAGLVAGYDKLLQVAGPDTRIVPANGPLLGRTDLQTHRKMYFTIYDRLVQSLLKGVGADEIVATPTRQGVRGAVGQSGRFRRALLPQSLGTLRGKRLSGADARSKDEHAVGDACSRRRARARCRSALARSTGAGSAPYHWVSTP